MWYNQAMLKIETGQCIQRERVPVNSTIIEKVNNLPQTHVVGMVHKRLDEAPAGHIRGAIYIFITPHTPTYDQTNLDKTGKLVDQKISLPPNVPDRRLESFRFLKYPWRAYDEVIKPFPAYAATDKGEKTHYRTNIIVVPDKEIGELLLLHEDLDLQSLADLIKQDDLRIFGKDARDYNYLAKKALLGLERLSYSMPASLAESVGPNGFLMSHLLLEELKANERRRAYLNAAIEML